MVDIYLLLTLQQDYRNEELKRVSPRITILLRFVIDLFLKSQIIYILQITVKKKNQMIFDTQSKKNCKILKSF